MSSGLSPMVVSVSRRGVISNELKSVTFDAVDKIEINEYRDLILYRTSSVGKQTIKMCLADHDGRVTITID